jgi:hypothetical protein
VGDISIDVIEHHWLANLDPSTDLCSHGRVLFRVDGRPVVRPEDGEYTLSAAALYLLRTLERDHNREAPVGDHLLPCCGHVLFDDGGSDVGIIGCPNGVDWSVNHEEGAVRLWDGRRYPLEEERPFDALVPIALYRRVVMGFARTVWELFENAEKRIVDAEDRRGYTAFCAEYRRRLSSASQR